MKLRAWALIGLISIGLGVSCGKRSGGLKDTETTNLDSNQWEELFVWVEVAQVRKEADPNAEVVAVIKGGEQVMLTGEKSTNKAKLNLRGVDFEDIWVKVKTEDGKEGWIFKGMLISDQIRAMAMNDFLMTPGKGVGRVDLGDTQADVVAEYGEAFVIKSDIYLEGDAYPGYIVFKNSPMELQCKLDENGKTEAIFIHQPNAPWQTAEGVKMGMRLDQLIQLNGKDLKFSGFGWDYGGGIISYNNGKLAKYENFIWLYLGEPESLDGLEEFLGDAVFSTSSKKLPKDKIRIADIMVQNLLLEI